MPQPQELRVSLDVRVEMTQLALDAMAIQVAQMAVVDEPERVEWHFDRFGRTMGRWGRAYHTRGTSPIDFVPPITAAESYTAAEQLPEPARHPIRLTEVRSSAYSVLSPPITGYALLLL